MWGVTLDTGDVASYSVSIRLTTPDRRNVPCSALISPTIRRLLSEVFNHASDRKKFLQQKSGWHDIRFNVMIIVRGNNTVSQFSRSVEA